MMSKRGETWSDKRVLALISIWETEAIMNILNNSQKNTVVYGQISKEMEALVFKRDANQCRTKVKHLKTAYKKIIDALFATSNRQPSDLRSSPVARCHTQIAIRFSTVIALRNLHGILPFQNFI